MPIFTNYSDIAGKSFDYIVVGGGTAGLALATRLSEDSGVTVVVLEAGESHLDDPIIDIPGQYGATFMNPKYDWSFPTINQKHSNDKKYIWGRGKGLGGSSAMNYFCWVKPPAADINAFEKLGNPGWNWPDFEKYSKKSETYNPADNPPHIIDPKSRGTSGPIETRVALQAQTLNDLFLETLVNKGIKKIEDPFGGDITGTWIGCSSMDKNWKRSYSATGYLAPNIDRSNLIVLTGALVSRVIFADLANSAGELIVTGVEFIHSDEKHTVLASREVIVSAGTIKSPQILELSGIGQPSIHAKIGVETKIDLPGVGENVQEHHLIRMVYELDSSTTDHQTYDLLFDPEYAKDSLKLHAEGKGLHRIGATLYAFLPFSRRNPKAASKQIDGLEKEIETLRAEGLITPSLSKQYDVQLAILRDDTLPDLEFLVSPGFSPSARTAADAGPEKRYISIISSLNHPFSRGTIHAKTNDPLDHPEIDPNYFGNKFDLEVLAEHVKFLRSMAEVEPFKSGVVREVLPGPNCVTDEDIVEFVINKHSTTYHTASSCSMLPREDLGVVDAKLKVYGTKNLRVADLSIIPLHVAAHTQATVYAIGEKAADIIRDANKA